MNEADTKRLKALEKVNAELKKIYAEAMHGIKVLKETIEKSFEPRSSPRFCLAYRFQDASRTHVSNDHQI
ncbi:hypothetical protein N8703_03670 [Verrucomicrobia bacterium]|nr:hypothetical protein [Verrucomicrobiota bacterium]